MKKVILSAFVAIIAISASAFTNVQQRFNVPYYQNVNGEYYSTPPSGSECAISSDSPCELLYESNVGEGFTYGDRPTTGYIGSSTPDLKYSGI